MSAEIVALAGRLSDALAKVYGRVSVGMDATGSPDPKSVLALVLDLKKQQLQAQRDSLLCSAMLDALAAAMPQEAQDAFWVAVGERVAVAVVRLEKLAAAQNRPASGLVLPRGAGRGGAVG